jgi:ABC-type multidrug transport system permease subunit
MHETKGVTVTDIQMPFGSMVIFMIKWAIASIPAAIILFLIASIFAVVFGGIFSGMTGLMR